MSCYTVWCGDSVICWPVTDQSVMPQQLGPQKRWAGGDHSGSPSTVHQWHTHTHHDCFWLCVEVGNDPSKHRSIIAQIYIYSMTSLKKNHLHYWRQDKYTLKMLSNQNRSVYGLHGQWVSIVLCWIGHFSCLRLSILFGYLKPRLWLANFS